MSAVAAALARAAEELAAGSDTPRLDAETIMAAALGIERSELLMGAGSLVVPAEFESMLQRRLHGEPVAYIVGRRGFWTIDLEVGPGVLIPRPDSETLLDAAVAHFVGRPGPKRILDLGTGPGTLLLAALDEWPEASGIGIDRSDAALSYARRNADRLGLAGRVDFRLGNWADAISEAFELVLANPPYVAQGAELGAGVGEFEPREALFAGSDGLDAYRELAPQLDRLIAPGGLAAIEIGYDQAEGAAALFVRAGLSPDLARDLAGRPRALLLRAP